VRFAEEISVFPRKVKRCGSRRIGALAEWWYN
jgi:hypothetical protein